METCYFSAAKCPSIADRTSLLILQELKLLRKDLNLGILKLREDLQLLQPALKPTLVFDKFSRNDEVCNFDINSPVTEKILNNNEVQNETELKDSDRGTHSSNFQVLHEKIKSEVISNADIAFSSCSEITEQVPEKSPNVPGTFGSFCIPQTNVYNDQQSLGANGTAMSQLNVASTSASFSIPLTNVQIDQQYCLIPNNYQRLKKLPFFQVLPVAVLMNRIRLPMEEDLIFVNYVENYSNLLTSLQNIIFMCITVLISMCVNTVIVRVTILLI